MTNGTSIAIPNEKRPPPNRLRAGSESRWSLLGDRFSIIATPQHAGIEQSAMPAYTLGSFKLRCCDHTQRLRRLARQEGARSFSPPRRDSPHTIPIVVGLRHRVSRARYIRFQKKSFRNPAIQSASNAASRISRLFLLHRKTITGCVHSIARQASFFYRSPRKEQ